MSKITLTDTPMEVITRMSDGNPGAFNAIMEIISKGGKIDPQGTGGLGAILSFDTQGIYGSAIYILWSDKCERDTRRLLMLSRATQLGFLPASKLFEMSQDQRHEINLTEEEFIELDDKVTDRLEDFQKRAA